MGLIPFGCSPVSTVLASPWSRLESRPVVPSLTFNIMRTIPGTEEKCFQIEDMEFRLVGAEARTDHMQLLLSPFPMRPQNGCCRAEHAI